MFTFHFEAGTDVKVIRAAVSALQAYADAFEPGEKVLPMHTRDEVTEDKPTPKSEGAYAGETKPEVVELEPEVATADVDGVEFDPQYCAKAAEPFYKSGKRKGQWKKGKGISDAVYDLWHKRGLPETVDSGAAFNQTDQTVVADVQAPTDAGAFMLWISEQQAAGKLDQPVVDAAYAQAGITVPMLFDVDAEKVAGYVATLHNILTS